MTNSADPDQLATDLDLHCLLRQGMTCSAREGLIYRSSVPSCSFILLLKSSRKIHKKTFKLAVLTSREEHGIFALSILFVVFPSFFFLFIFYNYFYYFFFIYLFFSAWLQLTGSN